MQNSRHDWEQAYKREDPYGAGGRWISERKRVENSFALLPAGQTFKEALDLCAGEGHFTERLTTVAEKITSVELSANAVSRARTRLVGKNVALANADAFALDFPPESFDLICSIECLRYTADRKTQLGKWARWLRPNGLLLVTGAILPGYFSWSEFIGLIEVRFEIKLTAPVSTRCLIAKLANHRLLPFPELLYDGCMVVTRLAPRLLAKHIAVLASPKTSQNRG